MYLSPLVRSGAVKIHQLSSREFDELIQRIHDQKSPNPKMHQKSPNPISSKHKSPISPPISPDINHPFHLNHLMN